jgi:hypothetical protein
MNSQAWCWAAPCYEWIEGLGLLDGAAGNGNGDWLDDLHDRLLGTGEQSPFAAAKVLDEVFGSGEESRPF